METNPRHGTLASRVGGTTAMVSLTATFLLVGGSAHAQNSPPALTLVPDHVFLVRGASFREGDLFAMEPSGLFVFGPIRRPVVGVARAVVGAGGSGVGIGLAVNAFPRCWDDDSCLQGIDFFVGPFVSLEARVERMYGHFWRTSGVPKWRDATYAGPQLSFSVFVLKASVGWMVDVTDQTNHHAQLGLGFGF